MYCMRIAEVEVPHAFDLRPLEPDCSCFPDQIACQRCCDRSLGHRGDPRCWGDERRLEGVWSYQENQEARVITFPGLQPWRSARFWPCFLPTPAFNQAKLCNISSNIERLRGPARLWASSSSAAARIHFATPAAWRCTAPGCHGAQAS